jgi:hypothetical protein
MGGIKLTDFNGGNGYSAVITPAFDIDAINVSFGNRQGNGSIRYSHLEQICSW